MTLHHNTGDDEGRQPRQRIGPALRTLRQRSGWSIGQVAEQIHISRSHLARLERGESDPSYVTLSHLAQIYGVDLNYFSSFDQMSAEIDDELSHHLDDLSFPQETWHEFSELSIEARGALNDALSRLSRTEGGERVPVLDLEEYILQHGVQASVPLILEGIRLFGMEPVEFVKALAQIEEVPGDRLSLINRLSAIIIPIDGGIEPEQVFLASFGRAPTDPLLVKWWSQTLQTAVEQNLREHTSRAIIPRDTIARYISTGEWSLGLKVSPTILQRHIKQLTAKLRQAPRYRFGLSDNAAPLNMLIKGSEHALIYRRLGESQESFDSPRFALRVYRPDLIRMLIEYYEETWSNIPEMWRDQQVVIDWMEQRTQGIEE